MPIRTTTARPSSNLNSIGINVTFLTSCLFALLGGAVAIAALVAPHWFDYANQSANSLDLWQSCSGSNCTAITFTDVNIGLCVLSGKEIQGRFFALRGLLIAGAVFCFFYTLFVIVARVVDSLSTHVVGVVCSVLASFCFACVIALFYNTAGYFMFCGLTPCSYFENINPTSVGKCYYMYGGAYGLVWCAIGATVVAAVMGLCAVWRMRSPERLPKIHGLVAPSSRPGDDVVAVSNNDNNNGNGDDDDEKQQLSPTRRNNHQDMTASAADQLQRQRPTGLEEWRMNAQDFDFDDETGLYYSDEAQVYWDKSTNQFFDPSRRLWWDPVDRKWKNDA